MSLPRTPPNEPSGSASSCSGENICSVCTTAMSENDHCLIISKCSHSFHRSCIENYLSNTEICPSCKIPCDLSDLKKINFSNKQDTQSKQSLRGRGRGNVTMPYNTRSQSRTLFHDSQRGLTEQGNDVDDVNNSTVAQTCNSNRETLPNPSTPHNSQNSRNQYINIDCNQLNQMIETTMARLLSNFNINPAQQFSNNHNVRDYGNVNTNSNYNTQISSNRSNPYRPPNYSNQPGISNSENVSHDPSISANCSSSWSGYKPDKLTSIIQGWNIKFHGSASGIPIGEFLYRIKSLTKDYFNGDFTPIMRNLNVLLNAKAKDWYWRYRKQVTEVNWMDFSEAIQGQFRDFKTTFDLKEEIRNRKQKIGETFDIFFDNILSIMDRLPTPIPEMELIEIVSRNLRPEIRQDILYIPVHSIPHLRKLVHMRETFWNEDQVRRNLGLRSQNYPLGKRQISEVELNENSDIQTSHTNEVNALVASEKVIRCWNCGEKDHFWYDCIKERKIFCYGCGEKDTYKPQCPKCAAKKISISKNYPTNSKN